MHTMNRTFQSLVFLAFLWIGFSCSEDKGMMLRQLEALEQANRDDSLMTNDSLAETLVAYFDKHGSANERMRARYMLGRTYYDLGELPHALETYLEAADCADTALVDCDYTILSKIHIQSALIYEQQIQPQSQLYELRLAEMFARKGNNIPLALECYSQTIEAFKMLEQYDSVITIAQTASDLFKEINKPDRSAQILGSAISSLLKKGELSKARMFIEIYEAKSGFFDKDGNIKRGREIYYYAKGKYYLAANQVDSAEAMFRKLLVVSSLNCQIAGYKGLQEVYEKKYNSDSIAKFAKMGYELNDSAYSLSEMQNIQKLQASYNYNHNKHLAEKKTLEAERTKNYFLIFACFVCLIGGYFLKKYIDLTKLVFDYRLRNSLITRHFHKMAKSNPPQIPCLNDWKELRLFVEKEIPSFSKDTNKDSLTDFEYDVCLMIRVYISPMEISKLKSCSPSNVSNVRKRLLLKIFNKEGSCEDFDDEIWKICK